MVNALQNLTKAKELNERKVKKISNKEDFIVENLNIETLSIAKFFYEKGAKNIALIQRLIYLSFLKVIKEEKVLLFTED